MSIQNQNLFPATIFLSLSKGILRGIRPVFSPRCRGFFRLSRAGRALCARGFRLSGAVDFEEWAATKNPATALLPPDSLVAHPPARRAATADLTALAQGRSVGAEKLCFAETPLFDFQQIARVYRDDGLFFGAVKIENDAARALRLLP